MVNALAEKLEQEQEQMPTRIRHGHYRSFLKFLEAVLEKKADFQKFCDNHARLLVADDDSGRNLAKYMDGSPQPYAPFFMSDTERKPWKQPPKMLIGVDDRMYIIAGELPIKTYVKLLQAYAQKHRS